MWNDVGFPFQVKRTWIDGVDKRAVSIELQGGKGIKLTLTCGYFENIAAGEDKQTKFYNFLARGIPKQPHDPKQMFIEIGDKNCVINPTCQQCRIGIERKEPNTKLLEFMAAFNLTEPIMAQPPRRKNLHKGLA